MYYFLMATKVNKLLARHTHEYFFFSSDSQRGRAGEDSESAAQRDDFDARPGRGNVRISNARKSERPERGP